MANRFLLISAAPVGDCLSYCLVGNGIRKEITMLKQKSSIKISYQILSSNKKNERWGIKEIPTKTV